ncbi:XP_028572535.1uncharacterized protein LOC114590431 [Podarcis lilfordi]|uniref:XP_028572535.1uncharacterized protein LOC114590431 n=1 Tax=Podarcis lilfordi TaxID=74358 RepID=A0AA35PWI7_9SAUR|nr:XP_028572535.1uncharacterized protein LOC114590431 [Podarcis lilfordi]
MASIVNVSKSASSGVRTLHNGLNNTNNQQAIDVPSIFQDPPPQPTTAVGDSRSSSDGEHQGHQDVPSAAAPTTTTGEEQGGKRKSKKKHTSKKSKKSRTSDSEDESGTSSSASDSDAPMEDYWGLGEDISVLLLWVHERRANSHRKGEKKRLYGKRRYRTPRAEHTFENWLDGYQVFMGIVSVAYPKCVMHLIANIAHVRRAFALARENAALSYDEDFRRNASLLPSTRWDLRDQNYWMEHVGPYVEKKSQDSSKTGKVEPKWRRQCWDFNKGVCSRSACRHAHECERCLGSHPASACFKGGRECASLKKEVSLIEDLPGLTEDQPGKITGNRPQCLGRGVSLSRGGQFPTSGSRVAGCATSNDVCQFLMDGCLVNVDRRILRFIEVQLFSCCLFFGLKHSKSQVPAFPGELFTLPVTAKELLDQRFKMVASQLGSLPAADLTVQRICAVLLNENDRLAAIAVADGDFQDFLEKREIDHKIAVSEASWNKSVCVKVNTELQKGMKAQLLSSHLPQEFWAELLSAYSYTWQLQKDEMFLSCVLATCSEAHQREKHRLRYSKKMAVKAIADLMGRIVCFTQPELVLATALESLYQLSLMKPKLPLKLHSLIVHAAFAAVIEVKTEPDKQELRGYTTSVGRRTPVSLLELH